MFGGHIEKEKDNFLQKTRQERENRQKARVQSVAAVKIQVRERRIAVKLTIYHFSLLIRLRNLTNNS